MIQKHPTYIALLFLLTFSNFTIGQISQIGDGVMQSSAKLQLNSTSKGFLMPRMTTTQIESIVNPTQGLQVYSSSDKCIHVYNGHQWKKTCGQSIENNNTNPSNFHDYNRSVNRAGESKWISAIHIKNFEATSPSTEGGNVVITTGLTHSQIIEVMISVDEQQNGSKIPPRYTFNPEYEYDYKIQSSGNIVVSNKNGNSSRMLSKPMTVQILCRSIVPD